MTEHRKELQNRPQQRPSRPPNQYVYKKTSCFGSHSGCPHCIQNRLGLLFIISSTLVYLQPKITSIVIWDCNLRLANQSCQSQQIKLWSIFKRNRNYEEICLTDDDTERNLPLLSSDLTSRIPLFYRRITHLSY